MLILQHIEIENFVCFDSIEVEPSTDIDHPLTVIRAENGSGKTTFLRALRWGMYGEKALPGVGSRFPIQPAWWQPDAVGIETRVSIEFEADGTDRNFAEADNHTSLYRLERTVMTKGVQASNADAPDFRRIEERVTLMIKELDGHWKIHDKGPNAVIEQLLPWGLRDFFVMDTDEATDFVGGSENKTIPRQEVQEKTTAAITNLLGISIFKSAKNRVESLARGFSSKATKAIGEQDLTKLDEDLNDAREIMGETEEKINKEAEREAELTDRLERLEEDLEAELLKVGSHQDLKERLKKAQEQYQDAVNERATCAAKLAADLKAPDLLAVLASAPISRAYDYLKPLHDQGMIPLAYLPFVQGLMESGRCVCGQHLSEDNDYGIRVRDRINESAVEADRASFLYQLHDAARSLQLAAESSNWNERRESNAASLSKLDVVISDLITEEKDINSKLDLIDDEQIQMIREAKRAVMKLLDTCRANLLRHRERLPELEKDVLSLAKNISQRHRNKREADDHRAAEQLSQQLVGILERAYSTIEQRQVNELSNRMNRLFDQMAANVSVDDFSDSQPNKATLRMISQVGVRPIENSPGKFEIFALNNLDRPMSPVQINGASRRVMALSFVLALCVESQTRAPLIADSLLNSMSGAVRRNTLRVTSEHSKQPILLLTNADLEAHSEVETVRKYAGATYTLTGQWEAIDAGSGGDVVNWTKQRQVSLLCPCGPRQYCDICERTGQRDAPGWAERTSWRGS